jgi:hypothetical protein
MTQDVDVFNILLALYHVTAMIMNRWEDHAIELQAFITRRPSGL